MELNEKNINVEISSDQTILATRRERFVAAIIDLTIIFIIYTPLLYLAGSFDNYPNVKTLPTSANLLINVLSTAIFISINFKMLISSGQTIGKKLVGIKIVKLDGGAATLKSNLMKRYAIYFIPSFVPVIGIVFSLIDDLFIFGKNKRCLRDLFADTKVVKG